MIYRINLFLITLVSIGLSIGQIGANSADSSNVTVDTRTLTMTTLVVTGPSTVAWPQEAAFTATLNYQGAAPEDVTSQCEWSVSGGGTPTTVFEIASMNGNILKPGMVSTVPLQVSAKITRNNGKIASNALAVTVTEGNGMNIGIGRPLSGGPTYVRKSGLNLVWTFGAEAYGQALMKYGVTVAWYLDGAPLATGIAFNKEVTGQPGAKTLKVVATDAQGRTGQSTVRVSFDVPPTVNEPQFVRALDPEIGDVVTESGSSFEFASDKKSSGLIVLTHGLTRSSADEAPAREWLRNMAIAVRKRFENEGKQPPNVAVFEWFGFSNPNTRVDTQGLLAKADDLIGDLKGIMPNGQITGQNLAAWFVKETNLDHISTAAPVHLIGHSAGGFVMGECAWQLKNKLGLGNVRVTMLDTPFPCFHHLKDIPGSGWQIDRYVSSLWGDREDPRTAIFLAFGNSSYQRVVLSSIFPLAGDKIPTITAHSYSHVWYDDTIWQGDIGSQGFGWSPVLNTAATPAPVAPRAPRSPNPPVQADTPITGFTTFGTASSIADGFQLTEGDQTNAGITLADYPMPVGAQAIRFNFQFTDAGDGDFVVVSHGDTVIGFGADNTMSRDGEISVEMPVEHLAGTEGDLVFRLTSRGSPNAGVTITAITLTTVDDPDIDGLTNQQETAAGTNPLLADTDGDGIDDATEINTNHTNPVAADTDGDGSADGSELAAGTDPLDGTSRFAIKSSVKSGTDFTVTWSSVAGRTYRVVKSPQPTFDTYDVVGSGIAATPPQQSFTDTGGANGARLFYRVEVEP